MTTDIIPLVVEPIKGRFGTIGTVRGSSLRFLVGDVSAAPPGEFRLGNGNIRRRASDVALEAVHVVCENLSEDDTRSIRSRTHSLRHRLMENESKRMHRCILLPDKEAYAKELGNP